MPRYLEVGPLRPTALLAIALLALPGCDLGLEALNTDETRLRTVEPQFQLNNVILNSAPQTGQYRCESTIVQQHLRVFTGVAACGNFNVAARTNMDGNWTNGYSRLVALQDVLDATKDDPARQNLYNMA